MRDAIRTGLFTGALSLTLCVLSFPTRNTISKMKFNDVTCARRDPSPRILSAVRVNGSLKKLRLQLITNAHLTDLFAHERLDAVVVRRGLALKVDQVQGVVPEVVVNHLVLLERGAPCGKSQLLVVVQLKV